MVLSLAVFFIIGCVLLCLLTLIVYTTGIVHKTRDSSGQLNRRQSPTGIIILLIVQICIIAFFVAFSLFSFRGRTPYLTIALWNLSLILLLLMFDSFFIDLLLIGRIRPKFLAIPAETTFQTMKAHVVKTFTVGWVLIIPIVLISSAVAFLLLA